MNKQQVTQDEWCNPQIHERSLTMTNVFVCDIYTLSQYEYQKEDTKKDRAKTRSFSYFILI